jgi:hypothetical protein
MGSNRRRRHRMRRVDRVATRDLRLLLRRMGRVMTRGLLLRRHPRARVDLAGKVGLAGRAGIVIRRCLKWCWRWM